MPTERQRRLVKAIGENIRRAKPLSAGELVLSAGYSKSLARKPKLALESRGIKEAMEEAGITDDAITKVMMDGLQASKTGGEPDHAIRHKYLETAVKLKGYKVEGTGGNTSYNAYINSNNINPNAKSARELADNTLAILMEQTKEE